MCGPQDDPQLPSALTRLAKRLGYPILADALSGVRHGDHDRSLVVDAYDAFLRDAATVDRLEPAVVIRFGAMPTSKPLQQYLQRYAGARQVLVDAGGWRDPTGLASDVLHVDPRLLCEALFRALPASGPSNPDWAASWMLANSTTRRAISEHFATLDELFEGKVFSSLPELLPEGAVLYAGNSMPVRDLDTFLPSVQDRRCAACRIAAPTASTAWSRARLARARRVPGRWCS